MHHFQNSFTLYVYTVVITYFYILLVIHFVDEALTYTLKLEGVCLDVFIDNMFYLAFTSAFFFLPFNVSNIFILFCFYFISF